MVLPPIEPYNLRWDAYQAFHIALGPIIRLQSGQVFVTATGHAGASTRRRQAVDLSPYHIEILQDDELIGEFVDTDGVGVPRAWFGLHTEGAHQTLLIDYDTKHVVRLSNDLDDECTRVLYNTGCKAYFTHAGAEPVGSPVQLSQPYAWTKDEYRHMRDISDSAAAWAALEGKGRFTDGLGKRDRWSDSDGALKGKVPWQTVLNAHSMLDLTELDRAKIAKHGVTSRKNIVYKHHVLFVSTLTNTSE